MKIKPCWRFAIYLFLSKILQTIFFCLWLTIVSYAVLQVGNPAALRHTLGLLIEPSALSAIYASVPDYPGLNAPLLVSLLKFFII